MADYILSVDGGGTKTEFCISDMEGHIKESVVVDGNVITGRGPAYAFKFGLAILEQLTSKKVAEEVAAGMLLD